MQNFNWTKFTKKISIQSDIETVYKSWLSSKELEKWFLAEAIYIDGYKNELASTDLASSECTYSWKWYAQEHVEIGKIIEANGKDYLLFNFAGSCRVSVALEELGEETLVTLTQSEIPEDDESKVNIRLGCASAWAFYLVNLKSVLEGGIDLRNKKKIKGLVNN